MRFAPLAPRFIAEMQHHVFGYKECGGGTFETIFLKPILTVSIIRLSLDMKVLEKSHGKGVRFVVDLSIELMAENYIGDLLCRFMNSSV
jgi:hypothetical protein